MNSPTVSGVPTVSGASTGAEQNAATREPREWGERAIAAHAAKAMKPAWSAFLKTRFVAPILRSPDDNPRNYLLYLAPGGEAGQPTLIISEVRDRLDLSQGDGIVTMTGADILRRLNDQGGIHVLVQDGMFSVSQRRVAWLRSGLEVATKRVGFRRLLQAAAPAAPLPVLRVGTSAELVPVPEPDLLPRLLPLLRTRTAAFSLGGALLVAIAGLVALRSGTTAPPRAFEAPNPVAASAAASGTGPALAAPASSERSLSFAPVDNSFSVSLPGPAEEVELSPDQVAQLDGLGANFYRLLDGGVLYQMEVIQYAGRMPPDIEAALEERQKAVIGTDRLLDARPLNIRGASGREVRVRTADGGERVARFIFSGEKLCAVSVSAPPGEENARRSAAFLASFQLR